MAQTARERPGVYVTSPNLFSLRLSDDQKDRIKKAAKLRSKTASDLIRDAIMTYVIGIEEEDRERKQAQVKAKEATFVPRSPKPPRIGIGVPFVLPGTEPAPPPPSITASSFSPPPAPAPQQIIIQSAPAAAAERDDVGILVDYLAGAKNIVERKERERAVDKIIRSSSKSVEDQKRLAKAIDERIAARTPTQAPKSGWSLLK